jgi:hypothetical protein
MILFDKFYEDEYSYWSNLIGINNDRTKYIIELGCTKPDSVPIKVLLDEKEVDFMTRSNDGVKYAYEYAYNMANGKHFVAFELTNYDEMSKYEYKSKLFSDDVTDVLTVKIMNDLIDYIKIKLHWWYGGYVFATEKHYSRRDMKEFVLDYITDISNIVDDIFKDKEEAKC